MTLAYLALSLEARYLPSGRSPGLQIILLAGPSHRKSCDSGIFQLSSLLTVAGQRRTFTGLPVHLRHNILL